MIQGKPLIEILFDDCNYGKYSYLTMKLFDNVINLEELISNERKHIMLGIVMQKEKQLTVATMDNTDDFN